VAKDFVVPLMALENMGVWDAWQQLLPMLAADKLSYAGYLLMKLVLTIASAILFGIINLFVVLIMVIILGVVSTGAFFFGKAIGLSWSLYALHFFASRYQLLAIHMTRSPGVQAPMVDAPEPI
jgi:hypothetical protein